MTQALREKTSARRALVILVGLLVTIMALQGLASVRSGGFQAFAQATTPAGPAIKLLNPDTTSSAVMSDKQDADTAYHIVAAVSTVPTSATVRFELLDDTTRVAIIDATRVGSTDTWEAFWQIPDTVADGGYTLEAHLFSSGTFVSKDSQAVTVNQAGAGAPDPRTNTAETLEITYPANAGSLGYRPSDTSKTFIIRVITSADAPFVRGYYSTAAPGSEPDYTACGGFQEREDNVDNANGTHSGSITCTLADEDAGKPVTAVAAVTNDTPLTPDPAGAQPQFTDSGDGHRVTEFYLQDPSSITIEGSSTGVTGGCVAKTATVRDQKGAPVAAMNVDVHATGPTNNLKFDTLGDFSDSSQAPDQGPHNTEEAIECEEDQTSTPPAAAGGTQGFHPTTSGTERKHIESVDESDTNGQFVFALFSPDAGGTQITAFADEDGNDSFCSTEASGNSTIGWNSAAPSPTGHPADETTCSGATPTPTASATPSGSPTTASPTGTATSTGPTTARTITLATDKNKIPAGRQFTLSGNLLSGDSSCADSNEFVQIQRRIHGTTQYEDLFATAPNDQGRFEVTTRGRKSADYIAVAPAHDNCQQATSGEVTVLVKVVVQILPSDKTPAKGSRIRIKSSVRPQHDGTKLLLQRKKGRRWVTIDRTTLNKRSIGNFTVRASFNSRTFRTKWKSQHADHETGTSKAVRIRTH